MGNDIIKLIGLQKTVNEYGDIEEAETERTVFAETKSITQSEFYQAQAEGFRPEIKFVLTDYLDYQGESRLKYKPFGGTEAVYEVIRTYRPDDTSLEIVAQRGVDR